MSVVVPSSIKTLNGRLIDTLRVDWKNGFIDKYVAFDLVADEIIPFLKYDSEFLTHKQFVLFGQHVLHVRYNLKTKQYDEEILLVAGATRMLVCKDVRVGERVFDYLQGLSTEQSLLFPMSDMDMDNPRKNNFHEADNNFDAIVWRKKKFLKKLEAVDKEMFDFIIQELEFSFERDCPSNWNDPQPLPKFLNVRERLVVDTDGRSLNHMSEHWLLFYKDGSVTFPDLEPNKGAVIDGDSDRTIKIHNRPPHIVSEDVVKAIKIAIGVNPIEGFMRGVSWKLFKR